MAEVISVSALNQYVKTLLDANDLLFDLALRGEIANFVQNARSGHCYFSLRDETSSVKAVMFRSDARRLGFRPEEGMKVVVRCRATLYERDGAFQVYVNDMFPDGIGSAQLAFEQLKAKLDREGLFAAERKKPLPRFPKCIGLVTSKTGAALQDIRNVIGRRWPAVRLLLCPVNVQGFEAADEIAAAIDRLDKSGQVDEIIVARGGGSREDLWVFNAEEIARAAFRCKTPLISAIGHEIDYTILDFVADQRAPTPSAAAELAVPDREEQQRIFEIIKENIHKNIQKRLALCYNGLEQYNFLLEQSAPSKILQQYSSRLQQVQQAIQAQQKARMNDKNMRLQHAAALAASLDPYRVLARGYALVTDAKGKVCTVEQLQPEQTICVRSRQYQARCRVETVEEINESTQKL
jgi:exodeoxyribonuclease VII large subunit